MCRLKKTEKISHGSPLGNISKEKTWIKLQFCTNLYKSIKPAILVCIKLCMKSWRNQMRQKVYVGLPSCIQSFNRNNDWLKIVTSLATSNHNALYWSNYSEDYMRLALGSNYSMKQHEFKLFSFWALCLANQTFYLLRMPTTSEAWNYNQNYLYGVGACGKSHKMSLNKNCLYLVTSLGYPALPGMIQNRY